MQQNDSLSPSRYTSDYIVGDTDPRLSLLFRTPGTRALWRKQDQDELLGLYEDSSHASGSSVPPPAKVCPLCCGQESTPEGRCTDCPVDMVDPQGWGYSLFMLDEPSSSTGPLLPAFGEVTTDQRTPQSALDSRESSPVDLPIDNTLKADDGDEVSQRGETVAPTTDGEDGGDGETDTVAAGFVDDTIIAVSSPSFEANIRRLSEIAGKIVNWSATHGCQCDVKKFQMVHFTRNKAKRSELSLKVGNVEIKPTKTAKYLGIVVDSQLKWKEHVESAISKGTATLLAISRLTRPTFGLPHRYMKQLFTSVVLPKMEYGMEVWYEPIRSPEGWTRRKGSVATANRFTRVQRQAGIRITGAFSTTATDVLNYHANLEPTHLRMNRSVHNAAARLSSLPSTHPLAKHVKRCQQYPRFHRSPLHELMNAFPHLHDTEVIDIKLADHTWKPPYQTHIAGSKEEAIQDLETKYQNHLKIYADGSSIAGGVGAAAVGVTEGGGKVVRRQYLGVEQEHTIFESEVVGVILAADIAEEILDDLPKVVILLDNQAAVRSMARKKRQCGQELISEAHAKLEELVELNAQLDLTIAWIPGHKEVKGNEEADAQAKKAAEGSSTRSPAQRQSIIRHPPNSITAIKASYKKETQMLWNEEWTQCAQYQRIAKFDPNPPGTRTKKFYQDRSKRDGSLITQLRSGHIALNGYLHRIKAVDSPWCPRCEVSETVEHYLLHCARYREQRRILRHSISGRFELSTLLGDPDNIQHTIEFVHATNRFPRYTNSIDEHQSVTQLNSQ